MDEKTIYERIKNRREQLEISVNDVADALGVSRATVYRYESAEIEKVPTTIIDKLAPVLKTTPAYLMGWTDDPSLGYYQKDSAAEMAQKLFEDKDMRLLFDAAKDCRPEDLQMAADLLKRLKQTNPDG